MERTRSERTAIALQEHAAWESACRRTGYELFIANPTEWKPQWLAEDQCKVAGLYELARFHAQNCVVAS